MLNKISINSKLAGDLELTQSNMVCLTGEKVELFCELETKSTVIIRKK